MMTRARRAPPLPTEELLEAPDLANTREDSGNLWPRSQGRTFRSSWRRSCPGERPCSSSTAGENVMDNS